MTGWAVRALDEVANEPPPMPAWGGIVYPGRRHEVAGPPEQAKSLALDLIALEVVRAGGVAVLVDLELGERERRFRFEELGASRADLSRIVYIDPDAPPTPADVERLIGIVGASERALVVVDSAASAYALSGLDDLQRLDVQRFYSLWIEPFWRAGIATVVIDHMSKKGSASRYSFGSERKLGIVDVALRFEMKRGPLTRGGSALVEVRVAKDNAGGLPRPLAARLHLVSDPETHRVLGHWEAPDAVGAPTRPPDELLERISDHLEKQPEPVSRRSVEQAVTGSIPAIRAALDVLLAEGYVQETAGPRNARLCSLINPFGRPRPPRPDLVPTASQDAVDPPSTSSPVPRSLERDVDEVGVEDEKNLFEEVRT